MLFTAWKWWRVRVLKGSKSAYVSLHLQLQELLSTLYMRVFVMEHSLDIVDLQASAVKHSSTGSMANNLRQSIL